MSLNHWLWLALFCAASSFVLALLSLRRDRLPLWRCKRLRRTEAAMLDFANRSRSDWAQRQDAERERQAAQRCRWCQAPALGVLTATTEDDEVHQWRLCQRCLTLPTADFVARVKADLKAEKVSFAGAEIRVNGERVG